jgi:hypothetical protein
MSRHKKQFVIVTGDRWVSNESRHRGFAANGALSSHHERIPRLFAGCACRKLNPGILVMQSAQGWATKNVPGAIDGARDRCIFLQG